MLSSLSKRGLPLISRARCQFSTSIFPKMQNIAYGCADPSIQFLRIYPPSSVQAKCPVVFLVHGGFWRERWNIDNALLIDTVPDLTARGFAVCAIEYRRTGNGGGLPQTMDDFVASLQKLAELSKTPAYSYVDMERVTLLGHSAGGHAVLWLSSQLATRGLPFVPHRCVALAPVCDMVESISWVRDGDHPVADFLASGSSGCSDPALVSPSHILPLEVPTVLISALGDEDVPAEHVRRFHEMATAITRGSSSVKLVELTDAHHYNMIEPGSDPWTAVVNELCAR
jgi:acetyl esterase/lipase